MTEFHHIPIMLGEVLELLAPERGGIFVDGTLGGGGHSEGILKRLTDGRLYGIDRDGEAIAAASERLKPFGDKFKAIRGNFFDMKSLLANEGVTGVEGILLDLGVSSYLTMRKRRWICEWTTGRAFPHTMWLTDTAMAS